MLGKCLAVVRKNAPALCSQPDRRDLHPSPRSCFKQDSSVCWWWWTVITPTKRQDWDKGQLSCSKDHTLLQASPQKRGIDVVHRSPAAELTSVPCEPSIFLAGFKNRILHPHVRWKERSVRAVHPQTWVRDHLLKCLGKSYKLSFWKKPAF